MEFEILGKETVKIQNYKIKRLKFEMARQRNNVNQNCKTKTVEMWNFKALANWIFNLNPVEIFKIIALNSKWMKEKSYLCCVFNSQSGIL